jgi:hypothetical protein
MDVGVVDLEVGEVVVAVEGVGLSRGIRGRRLGWGARRGVGLV